MTYYSRSEWSARPPRIRYAFGGSDVEGIAIHWPAMGKSRRRTVAEVMASLRGWQDYHMDDQRWSDIGYQEAVDQDGNVYELRGLDHKSGANGNDDLNDRFGALLLVLGEGEEPSAAMMTAARARIARHRQLHPSSRRIVGHGQIRPGGTECPGPITQRLINEGAFEPDQEDDMALEQDDINRIATAVWAKEFGGDRAALLLQWAGRNAARVNKKINRLDPAKADEIARAVVAKLPAQAATNITAADLARALIAELAADDAE